MFVVDHVPQQEAFMACGKGINVFVRETLLCPVMACGTVRDSYSRLDSSMMGTRAGVLKGHWLHAPLPL